jgi:hypothetical protein
LISTPLNGITSQKTVFDTFNAVRTSNLTRLKGVQFFKFLVQMIYLITETTILAHSLIAILCTTVHSRAGKTILKLILER